ncbi:MAG TPA: helix-turn-helix domain-containing protein [Gemmatimonadales bacterium]|jgi:putative transcriptional regulator
MATKSRHYDELAESIRQMHAIERGTMAPGRSYTAADVLGPERTALIEARQRTGMSQAEMATAMGVSKRTLQDWEQGRRKPTGAARILIMVARRHPSVVREAAEAYSAPAKPAAPKQKPRKKTATRRR